MADTIETIINKRITKLLIKGVESKDTVKTKLYQVQIALLYDLLDEYSTGKSFLDENDEFGLKKLNL
jgi:hypothetical protein